MFVLVVWEHLGIVLQIRGRETGLIVVMNWSGIVTCVEFAGRRIVEAFALLRFQVAHEVYENADVFELALPDLFWNQSVEFGLKSAEA